MPRPASRLSLSSVALPLPSPLWRSFASASSPLLSPPSASTEGNVRSPPSPNASAASNASSTTFSASTLGNAAGVSASSAVSLGSGWLERLQSAGQIELYHMSHVALLAGVPLALLLSPSLLVVPVDLALGLLIPWHMHVGMVNVLEDYVPRPYRKAAVLLMTAVSIATALGVLKLNLCGAGLTESGEGPVEAAHTAATAALLSPRPSHGHHHHCATGVDARG